MRSFPDQEAKVDVGRAEPFRQSMRSFMTRLSEAGDLLVLEQALSTEFEVAACLAEVDSGPALRFDRVNGFGIPLVGNMLNSLPRIAMGLGTTAANLQRAIVGAIEAPLAHRLLAAAPCQEQVIVDPELAEELPIPRFFEQEQGAYITAGATVAKDRHTGHTNLSIARLMPLGGNRAFVGIAPNHHLAVLARAAHARSETLDIAVCVGNHPAVLVASCLYLALGDDEMKVAGALLGEPLEVVRCLGSDLVVPAHCECVLEGTLDAGAPVERGRSANSMGFMRIMGLGLKQALRA